MIKLFNIFASCDLGQPHDQFQVSKNNLDLIVNFCENMIDCRRSLQLDYFGEHFTREQCLMNKTSACDNCSRASQFKEVDATEASRLCIKAVQHLGDGRSFTVLQLVELFKGANSKKIVDSGMNNTQFHGHLSSWDRSDIQRLFSKLIIENYLREQITIIRDIPQTYVKLGPKVASLMTPGSKVKIMFAMTDVQTKKNAKKVEVAERDEQDDELRDKCYHDLMEVANAIAEEKGLTINQVMNMQALIEMSKRMPDSEAEMMQIPHVTKANFDKYGQRFLNVTALYSAQRLVNRMEIDEETNDFNDDGNDWAALGQEASTSSRGGGKRKFGGAWAKRGAKRFRANTSRGKKKTPVKKTAKKARSSTNLLPRPKPQF